MAASDRHQGETGDAVSRLAALAANLRWTWDRRTAEVLRGLDPARWNAVHHNPARMLQDVPPERLRAYAEERGGEIAAAAADLERYLGDGAPPGPGRRSIAYFSAEFGLAECIPFYAGGLGTLAGDHLKSASDLGLPVVGVGLTYRSGYFRQVLDREGWQNEIYEDYDFARLPLTLERGADGNPLRIRVPFPGREVLLQIWRAQVGRVPLFLLDSQVPENAMEDQDIARHLYGGDVEVRLRQELVLGLGGVRALAAVGGDAGVYHINEGHAAFLLLERMHRLMKDEGLSLETARERVAATTVFTTHTPVPAGFDLFGPEMLGHYLAPLAEEMAVPVDALIEMGLEERDGGYRVFNMALFAVRRSNRRNAVSLLHGRVSRAMWKGEWPDTPEDEVPVGSVTNGAHLKSWVHDAMDVLLEEHLGPGWGDALDAAVWARASGIPDGALWGARNRAKESLLEFVRARLHAQGEHHAGATRPEPAESGFRADRLTLGFARRFAPYKRATLLLRDRARLVALLTHPERPVQIVFAGKAHPANQAGKELLAEVVAFSRDPAVQGHVAVIEDYDIEVARRLVQGVDVWINTPRRPQEASGTSGMKAVVNGALNVSILDGWWDEAYTPERGWAIGGREPSGDEWAQDGADAEALYHVLETEVIPLFYRREGGLPRDWLAKVRTSLRDLAPAFHSHRMVRDYFEQYYRPALAAAPVPE